MTILRFILGLVVHVDLLAIAVLAAGIALLRTPRQRLARRLLIAAWLPLALVHLTPAGRWLLVALEDRFPRAATFPEVLPGDVAGLVVLGGSFVLDDSAARGEIVYNLAAPRLFDAIALARRYPRARIVFTGNAHEVALARRVFADHGVDLARLTFEGESQDTRDNARKSLTAAAPRPGERWALVTSALHMPRAMGLFRGAGWSILPCPVGYVTSGRCESRSWLSPLGGANGLAWRAAVHEWAGLVHHRLTGDSPELWPGP
jgi:uncharacterized SAM-binding protein YcdF (DUF218 family)